jgi:superfamily II DNA or RNA helicase
LGHFKCPFYGVSNYESIQNCRYYEKSLKDGKKVCPYMEKRLAAPKPEDKKPEDKDSKKDEPQNPKKEEPEDPKKPNNPKNPKDRLPKKKVKKLQTFKWDKIPDDALVIFDEAHRCKNRQTVNSVMLYTMASHLKTRNTKTRILLLSATVSDKPENFILAGYVLGLYLEIRDAKNFIAKVGIGFQNPMSGVHNYLYPNYASRMRIRDLLGLFPENQVLAQCYDMDTADEIEKQYKLIEQEVERLKHREETATSPLAAILYARMRIEQLKIPTLLEETRKFIDEGASVALFVNFNNTLETLKQELKTECVICGQQTLGERDKNVDDFNRDKSRIIICNIRSGGVGISLHDQIGDHARVSVISPSWSAQDIIQVLGRVYRARGKTPVRQRIIYCSGTVEEQVCENIKGKIANIGNLNDGDLLSYNIEGLTAKKDETPLTPEQKEEDEKNHILAQFEVLKMRKQRLTEELRNLEDELKNLEFIKNMKNM